MNTIPVLQLNEIEEDKPTPSRNHSIVFQNLSTGVVKDADLGLEVALSEVFA